MIHWARTCQDRQPQGVSLPEPSCIVQTDLPYVSLNATVFRLKRTLRELSGSCCLASTQLDKVTHPSSLHNVSELPVGSCVGNLAGTCNTEQTNPMNQVSFCLSTTLPTLQSIARPLQFVSNLHVPSASKMPGKCAASPKDMLFSRRVQKLIAGSGRLGYIDTESQEGRIAPIEQVVAPILSC